MPSTTLAALMILPVDAIRSDFESLIQESAVVITAPTGTGKSTQVPRWLQGSPDAPVLVIQPRRVAARAVAARICELEGEELGRAIGYRVRDDDTSSKATRLLVVTPGIVLSRPELITQASTVVLDELHERRLDTDLILALLTDQKARFVAMSATLDGAAVAARLNAAYLSVEARTYPVDISYLDPGADLPNPEGLARRVVRGISELKTQEGDVLVFLPGRGEIERCLTALDGAPFEVLPLHGSLNLKQQAAALVSGSRRRIILSTNVAETSLTIPGVRAVIDSGLVRRTTYHNGRSYLALAPIAVDSADQRAGRAGRVAAGECLRLWGRQARLSSETPPEIYRESLVPLVMTCAALEKKVEALPFLSEPKDYALSDARARLSELGAIARSPSGVDVLTDTGRALQGLPLDPWLSRILVEAKLQDCLSEAIDLVSGLDQSHVSSLSALADDAELESAACDAEALIWAVRHAPARGPEARLLTEARRTRARLRSAFGLGSTPDAPLRRELLVRTLLKADPASAYVARQRKSRTVFSNGGTELDVGRSCRVNRLLGTDDPRAERAEALVVLETHGAVFSGQDKKLLITLAAPVPLRWLAQLGLGELHLKEAKLEKKGPSRGKVLAVFERRYAGRTLETKELEPEGALLSSAVTQLFCSGRLHPKLYKEAQERVARRNLAHGLGKKSEFAHFKDEPPQAPLAEWLPKHLESLGVERAEDLALLSDDDWLPTPVPSHLAPELNERFPLEVDLGDSLYAAEFDLEKRHVTLSLIRGHRQTPPAPNYLPRFEGLKIFIEAGGRFHAIKR